jgi:DNA-binding SARP family transcriptional activator/DNA-binding XRE family transcriptional regulator
LPDALYTHIRARRVSAGLTQQQLADAAGVGVSTVRDLEQGRTLRPHPRSLLGITGALNMSAEEVRHARAAPTLRFGVLGPFEVWRAGQPLDVGPLSQRVVLGMLAARLGENVDQDTVADMLWGEHPPRSGAQIIYTYASRLRRTLEPGGRPGSRTSLIVTTPRGYQLRIGPDQADLLIFRRWLDESRQLRRRGETSPAYAACLKALSLWRGRPFTDIPRLRRLPEVTAIEAEMTAGVLEATGLACELNRAGQMIPALREISSWDPFNGAVQAALIRALAAAGEQAAAVRAFNDIQALLANELGVDPDPPVTEAYLRALRAPEAVRAPEALRAPEAVRAGQGGNKR